MKKLLTFLFILVALASNAQDPQDLETVNDQSYYNALSSYFYYHGLASDTIGVSDSIWTYTVRIRSRSMLKPHVYFELDSLGGTFDTTYVDLYSKVASYEPWVLRERATWYLGADTSGVLVSDSSHISEFWQFKVWSEDDAFNAKVEQYFFKYVEDK